MTGFDMSNTSRRSLNIRITKRPSVPFARKSALKRVGFALALLLFAANVAAETVVKVANGRVKEVWVERNEIALSYFHPVSGKEEDLLFRVNRETGFSGGFHWEELQRNEPVSIDYEEDSEGLRRALLIKRVPLRGVPIDHSAS